MKNSNGQDSQYRYLHLDPTLLRTRTSNTLINLLLRCRDFVDEELQSRIDYVVKKKENETMRVTPSKRRKA